jgi:chromosome partitioning protein
MKIISLAASKGGVGKTTLASAIAVELERLGKGPVAMIDLDGQCSLTRWYGRREADTPILIEATVEDLPKRLKLAQEAGCKYMVIDTPPAITEIIAAAMAASDFVIIPAQPSLLDLEAIRPLLKSLKKSRSKHCFVMTRANSMASLTGESKEIMSGAGSLCPFQIGDRQAYKRAMVSGRTGPEITTGVIRREIGGLTEFVLNLMEKKREAA